MTTQITTQIDSFKKLNSKEILEAMQEGALLKKTYSVYSYWTLLLPNGKKHYNFRKGSVESITNLCQTIERSKEGYTLKLLK